MFELIGGRFGEGGKTLMNKVMKKLRDGKEDKGMIEEGVERGEIDGKGGGE
ncbi:hypothetical protein [Bacillus pumilus]|uniref:hypothetical protein n=1 Tax=Bacillus pumilus TaxID=1408 RepID=UPI00164303B7|nr:hypothetical protein [Bacillus pumilus]